MTPERLEEIREALSTDNPAPLHRTPARELLTAYDSLRGEVERLRGALERVVTFHGDMVHGEDCPVRFCEYHDCDHEGEDDCEAHEDECECCLGVAFVARAALQPTPEGPKEKA